MAYECLGLYWDCTVSVCGQCPKRDECKQIFCTVTIPTYRRRVGDDVRLLASEASVSSDAVKAALLFLQDHRSSGQTGADGLLETEQTVVVKQRKKWKWSPERDRARFDRERRRSPLIAKLTTGQVIEKVYCGETHKIFVESDGYIYNGVKYPTLYAVVVAIVGVKECAPQIRADGRRPANTTKKTSPWSATRFFSLSKIMLSKEAERS